MGKRARGNEAKGSVPDHDQTMEMDDDEEALREVIG